MVNPASNSVQLHTLLWLLAGAIAYLSFGYTEMQGSDLWWPIAAGLVCAVVAVAIAAPLIAISPRLSCGNWL